LNDRRRSRKKNGRFQLFINKYLISGSSVNDKEIFFFSWDCLLDTNTPSLEEEEREREKNKEFNKYLYCYLFILIVSVKMRRQYIYLRVIDFFKEQKKNVHVLLLFFCI
jgi:hypothetical protein